MKSRYHNRYKNRKRFFCLCLTVGMAVGADCGIRDVAAASVLPAASQTEETALSMGSVPYFRDDAGRDTQMAEGYLYGYWDRRLCRYDLETLEETVLFEAKSPQSGDFCIWGDYIYFMVVPGVNSVGWIHGYLYRVKCDGSEQAVCLTSVKMPTEDYVKGSCGNFIMDTYDDILYLMASGGDNAAENLYFRLNRDGSLSRAAEEETLYGLLPEGYSMRQYSGLSLPYAMRNYGYLFASDEDGKPVRIDPNNQEIEEITALNHLINGYFTHDAIWTREGNRGWSRISLDHVDRMEETLKFPGWSVFLSWDEEGIYLLDTARMDEQKKADLVFMDWAGEVTTLRSDFAYERGSRVCYLDGDYFYYTVAAESGKEVVRLSLNREEPPETVADYDKNPYYDITRRETLVYSWQDKSFGYGVECRIGKVHFTEETEGMEKINAFLDELYAEKSAAADDYRDRMKENEETYIEWGAVTAQLSNTVDVCYMDENYVGICLEWHEYPDRHVRGNYGYLYYMFDRNTGGRLRITDVVNNSPKEVCGIIAPYIENIAPGGTGEEDWEKVILEKDRFFLTEEGIGIHFDVYELECHPPDVVWDIVVPYSAFDLREGRFR